MNRIKWLDSKSVLDEAIRFLRCKVPNRREEVIEHVECMGTGIVGEKAYSSEIIFKYYTASRASKLFIV